MTLPCGTQFLRKHWFPVLWSFIGFVSLFDCLMVVQFSDVILEVEENPVGSYLLALDNGNPWLFLRTKAAGTVLVLCLLVALYRHRRCWAVPVTGSVAIFQCGLLLYLTSGMPTQLETLTNTEHAWLYPRVGIARSYRSSENRLAIGIGMPL